jgi:hypothetical protein
MKTFSQILAEVAQPKAGDEIEFKDKHIVQKVDYPVDVEDQFTSKKPKAPKRRADYAKGEDESVYESSFEVPTAAGGEYDEEDSHKKYKSSNKSKMLHKEAKLDPVGKEDDDIDNDGDVDSSDKYLHNRRKTIRKAMKESISLISEKAKSEAQQKAAGIALAVKRGKMPKSALQGASAEMYKMSEKDLEDYAKTKHKGIPEKVTEEAEQLDELSPATLKSYRSKATDQLDKDWQDIKKGKPGLSNRVASKRVDGVEKAYQKLKKEETEQLDELSPSTLKSYMKKAGKSEKDLEKQHKDVSSEIGKVHTAVGKKSTAANAAHRATTQKAANKATTQYRAADKQIKDTSPLVKKKADIQRKLANRMDGMGRAAEKLQKEDLDEVFASDYAGMLGKFKKSVESAEAAHTKGNAKMKEYHLDNARSRLMGMKSTDTAKLKQSDHYDKYKKMRGMNEEVELDEVSKSTLSSYIKKASGNMAGNAAVAAAQASSSMKKSTPEVKRNIANRMKGITRASDKLAKEEVELDEVSIEKLRDYASAALQDKNKAKADNRWKYASKAMDKVAKHDVDSATERKYGYKKEEIELDEAKARSSAYHMTVPLQNGKIHPDHVSKVEKLKAKIKSEDEKEGTKRRVTLQGRMGKDNPNADKYKRGGPEFRRGSHAHQRIKLGDAQHADIYVHHVNEEVEQIDEGFKEKISGIIRREKQKSMPFIQTRTDTAMEKAAKSYAAGDTKKGDKYMNWREKSLKKEEVDLTENFKSGAVKLNDGSSVTVKDQDAKLLNQLFKDLNAENKKKMMKVAMTDKNGFNEILGFAREAI